MYIEIENIFLAETKKFIVPASCILQSYIYRPIGTFTPISQILGMD